ncbi:MAG: hypothetical protein KIT87_12650 [Anaerolineae bacterium]|nr:hypothetical protein [Anaerolineae bacterium]
MNEMISVPGDLRLDLKEKEGVIVGLVLGPDTLWLDIEDSLRRSVNPEPGAGEAGDGRTDWIVDWLRKSNAPVDLRRADVSYDGERVKAWISQRWLGLPYLTVATEGEPQADPAAARQFVETFERRKAARLAILGPEPRPILPIIGFAALLALGMLLRRRSSKN